jgi:hypothetical protein
MLRRKSKRGRRPAPNSQEPQGDGQPLGEARVMKSMKSLCLGLALVALQGFRGAGAA